LSFSPYYSGKSEAPVIQPSPQEAKNRRKD